jgi:DNA (cytosine-5)-methyltransferase 1
VQGFPEWFKIEVSRAQAYKQFGNSVSVPVIGAIFKEILYTLKNKDKLDKNININRITYDYSTQTRLIEA